MSDTLYDTDLARWSRQQADALRAAARSGSNTPVDWDHVAEEIEGLGASERRALSSHLRTVIEHLLKLQVSSSEAPRRGWIGSILRARLEIEAVLESSPSLRREVPELIRRELARARRLVAHDLAGYGEPLPPGFQFLIYDEDQVLGPWLPEPPRG
jgi:hypothetical protein